MLTAIIRKNRPLPVGSSSTGGTMSVTRRGAPRSVATGVKTCWAAVALMSDPADAMSSSGPLPSRPPAGR